MEAITAIAENSLIGTEIKYFIFIVCLVSRLLKKKFLNKLEF
jgi:hypothetical protein